MTHKITRVLLCFLSSLLFITGCQKKDEFYERPQGLADPIYQQLQTRGNFTSLLKVIDKAGYKETLSSAGFWTLFAANDDAFKAFLQENSLSSADAINEELASKIVRYSLTYDAEKSTQLSDYFSSKGWVESSAFRRRSVYYDFVYDGKDKNNTAIKVIDANRNGTFLATEFNNKHLPIFLTDYMQLNNVTASDYQYFYPNSTFTGFSAGPAKVLDDQKDIVAENGVIHVIDKVLLPPKSIDQYISSKPEYSIFKGLLEKLATYNLNDDITRRYFVLTGKSDKVYSKTYNSILAFSPNNENYFKVDANDAQTNSYSILVPTNAAIEEYAKNVLLKYYPAGTTLDQLVQVNGDILKDFLNAHLFLTPLWPSKFATTNTSGLGEAPKINIATDVVEKQALSNGLFYGVKKVQDANIFSTVFGSAYLNPKYSLMVRAMDYYSSSIKLKIPSLKYGLILIPDGVFAKMGFTYEPFYAENPFRFNSLGDDITWRRVIESHIIDFNNLNVPDLSGEGFLPTLGGEYIRYKNNRLISAGTLDSASVPTQSIKIDSTKTTFTNGPAYYANGLLSVTKLNVGAHIERYGQTPSDPFYKFWQYLKNNKDLYPALSSAGVPPNIPPSKEIAGVNIGVNYTIFIPTNAQMDKAVTDGLLPASFTPTLASDQLRVRRFIEYHIMNKVLVAPDGQQKGQVGALLQTVNGDPLPLNIIINTTSAIQVKDMNGRAANVINPASSILSNRTIIHQIDNYFKYTY